MPKIIEAIYEDGVFKPLEKVNLKPGERAKIMIVAIDDLINEFYGLINSDLTLEDIKKARYEAKGWRRF
ncbi:MAG: antitoxin family protein [Archaeoglobales archaeon]|nr:antitoxin family protein [Archaeoglobales archaeon]